MLVKRRILDVAIACALLVCAGLLLVANVKDRPTHNAIDRAVLRVASPLEAVVSWVVGGIGNIGNRYVFLRDVDTENRELRLANEKLRLELGRVRAELVDIRALESLLDFTERVPAKTVGARLVAGSLNAHFRLVRVRLSASADVRTGMPVVTGDGLVGRVESIIGDTCEVLLITDPRSSVDVTLPASGGRGVLTGEVGSSTYSAAIEQLDRDEVVKPGDPVVTSGLGGAFPYGVPVGVVKSASSDGSSLYQNVEVAAAADLSRLDRVLILLTVPPPPLPEQAGKSKRPSPERAPSPSPSRAGSSSRSKAPSRMGPK